MRKSVGKWEISGDSGEGQEWWHLTLHYNDSHATQMNIRGYEDILDLEYLVEAVKRDVNIQRGGG